MAIVTQKMLSDDDLRSRFQYHPPMTEDDRNDHNLVNTLLAEVAVALNNKLPEGREKAQVFTDLENARLHSNQAFAIARARRMK